MESSLRSIVVYGDTAEEVTARLKLRLSEVVIQGSGGITVMNSLDAANPGNTELFFSVDPYDSPDFAAEKILDELARLDLIVLNDGNLTEEEEEEIRKRLQGLGYID